ncbi:MAG: ribosomal protein S18-alanine N-acetyltransferase [Anaerolineaceae bacterium]
MTEPKPHGGRFSLRPMEPRDVASVLAVERSAFDTGWPATAFQNELTQNKMARYIVLEDGGEVIGFGGLWLMLDEAHVVTVAVRPERRRSGLGSLIVHGLLLVAQAQGMDVATLECRSSNLAARALYSRYGFYEVGLRHKYYADNQEDAVIMTTESLTSPAYQERLRRLGGELVLLLPGAESLVIPA